MFENHPTLSFLSEQDRQDILHNTPAKLAPGLADAAATNAKAKVKAYYSCDAQKRFPFGAA